MVAVKCRQERKRNPSIIDRQGWDSFRHPSLRAFEQSEKDVSGIMRVLMPDRCNAVTVGRNKDF